MHRIFHRRFVFVALLISLAGFALVRNAVDGGPRMADSASGKSGFAQHEEFGTVRR